MQEATIEALIQPAIEALDCELWGLQLVRSKTTLLRIYIDTEKGAGIEDCEKVSRQVSRILDVEDPINGEYTLEVSSPGLDRPLFTLEQYQRYSGHKVDIRLRMPFQGRRKYTGLLCGVEGEDVILQPDSSPSKGKQKGKKDAAAETEVEQVLFPINSIEKANVMPVFTN